MKTPIVPSITDEQLAEIERFLGFGGSTLKLHTGPLRGLIARLRAAEKDAARYRWLRTRAYGHFHSEDLYDLFSFNDEVIDVMVDEVMGAKK